MPYLKEKIELSLEEAELKVQQTLVVFGPIQKKILIFCVLAIIPAYFIAKSVAYHTSAGRLTNSLLTATPAFTNPLPPEIAHTIVTAAGTGIYSVAAQISNKNVDLVLDNVPYKIVLLDDKQNEVYSSTASLFLLPGQSKYILLPKVATNEHIASAKIELPQELPWKKRLSIPTIDLEASTPAVSNQTNPPAFTVQGTVYNNSPYQLNTVTVGFLLYDTKGTIIGISQRTEFTLKPFERRAYVQLWPGVYSTNVASVDVIPETDPLDPENISLPKEFTTPAANLKR